MPNPPFDVWAPTEIRRLREQADALERALQIYASNFGAQIHPAADAPPSSVKRERSAESGARVPRSTKYEPLIQAFEAAGHPLSHQEMAEIADLIGSPIDPARLRGMLFAQKQAGRARPVGDKYEWGAPKDAPATQEGPTPPEEGADTFI